MLRRLLIDMSRLAMIAAMGLSLGGIKSAQAQNLEPFSVRLYIFTTGFHAAIFYAKEKGWFKEAGLDIDIQDGTGSANTVNLVGAGNFDVGEAALPVVAQGRQKGLPIKAIACFEPLWEGGLLVPNDSPIKTVKDLAGKTVIYSASSFETPFLDTFFANIKVKRNDINLINIDGMSKVSAYAAGQADALITFVPLIQIVVEKSRPSHGIMFKDHGLALNSVGYFATEKTIKEKPRQLKAFVIALSRAFHDIRDGGKLDEAVQAILKNRPRQKLDAESLKAQWKSLLPYMSSEATKGKPYGWQAREDWEQTLSTMQKAGLLPVKMPAEAYYTNEFVPVAN